MRLKDESRAPSGKGASSSAARTLSLTKPARISLHQRILSEIRGKILLGEWGPGRRIPVEHELMKQYRLLADDGEQGAHATGPGGDDRAAPQDRQFRQSPAFAVGGVVHSRHQDRGRGAGLPYSFEILQRQKRRSTREDRALMRSDESVPVLEIACRHPRERSAVLLRVPPDQSGRGARGRQPAVHRFGTGRLAAATGAVDRGRTSHPGTGAASDAATMLKIKPGSPCLVVERNTRAANSAITFVRLTYPGNLHELVATFTPATFTPIASSPPAAGTRWEDRARAAQQEKVERRR